jgi:hypothetical protein
VAGLGGDDGGDAKESGFAGSFPLLGAFFCNNRRFWDLPGDLTIAFPMSFASASAEESPRVLAELSKCAPGVPLLSGAKLAFRVTRDATVGLTPVALGRSNGTKGFT